jgi:hypothetical protein
MHGFYAYLYLLAQFFMDYCFLHLLTLSIA